MKNTTLNRKTGNTMQKNAGTSHEPRRNDQAGDGADFAFNGQMGDGVNGHGTNGRHAGNYTGLTMRENYGSGPRRASENSQEAMHAHGRPVTKDSYRTAPDTAQEDGRINGGATVKRWPNSDAINVGMKG